MANDNGTHRQSTVKVNENDQPKVAIIILNWNGWKNTIECLESIYQIDYSKYEIILVDNGSKDDSVQKIEEFAKGKQGRIKFFQVSIYQQTAKNNQVNDKGSMEF